MKKYLKIIAIGLLVGSMIACSKNEPEEPYNPEYETVLSANLGKVWQSEPEFPQYPGYFYLLHLSRTPYLSATLFLRNYGHIMSR